MIKIPIKEAKRFMKECLIAAGAGPNPAEQHAELLFQADRHGHRGHGLNRLEKYILDIKKGICEPNNQPVVLKQSPSTALVDAKNVLGSTASHFGMDIAIAKAKNTGVGWVAVKASNHNGLVGYYAEKASAIGFIGLAFTNTSPLVAPTRSKKAYYILQKPPRETFFTCLSPNWYKPALGTNPLAVSAVGSQKEIFYLNMATSAVALGQLEIKRRKGEPLPAGWAQGPDGNETTDPDVAIKTSCLMPLGGKEETCGYKGYGLSALVDILSGYIAGSNYGHHVRSWAKGEVRSPANLGHSFVALNPGCFAPGFKDRLTDLIKHWRTLEPTDPKLPVLAPGDIEKKNAAETDASGFVLYVKPLYEASLQMAKDLNVQPMSLSN